MLSFSTIFLPKERVEENEGWQLCCQVIPNSLIRTSPVQVLGVSHNKNVALPLKGLQSYSGGNTKQGREFHSRNVRDMKKLREESVRAR